LSSDVEATLFGINLLLILIMQERDSVNGEIKWSVIPLIINNSYMLSTNLYHYFYNTQSNEKNKKDLEIIPSSPCSSNEFKKKQTYQL
jgi:hypothetical protein